MTIALLSKVLDFIKGENQHLRNELAEEVNSEILALQTPPEAFEAPVQLNLPLDTAAEIKKETEHGV